MTDKNQAKRALYMISAIIIWIAIFGLAYYFFLSAYANRSEITNSAWEIIPAEASSATVSEVTPEPIIEKRTKPAKKEIRGIYLTAYSAGSQKKITNILAAADKTKVNAVVIDIKDYSGYLSYDSKLPLVDKLGLEQVKIKDLPGTIKTFKDKGFYLIARIAVFQDPLLSTKKPEWAVLNKNTNKPWMDRKGISWLDPANPEVWKYHVDIAKEVVSLGFDEVNLDYIRFPSDGQISTMKFQKWDGIKLKSDVIMEFFSYFHDAMKDEPAYLSADLFGMTTTAKSDLNIGQVLEKAAPYFDYLCPMVYPSHYPTGYLKFKNPAEHPYEVIYKDISSAVARIASSSDAIAQIRPWIQDFNMGAIYNASMIKKEIKASADAGGIGWLSWDPKNIYTWEAYK
jgi:hypothetical protein